MTWAPNQIHVCESGRGDIKRTERAALGSDAQALQDFLDTLIYSMAGITSNEAEALESRLSTML
jgi:hypothetical protein